MSTISHGPMPVSHESSWLALFHAREMWAALAITAIWAAVAISAVWGPDIVVNGDSLGSGGSTTVPSAVVIVVFAFLASGAVARYGLGRGREDNTG
jgi:hypothetical protein